MRYATPVSTRSARRIAISKAIIATALSVTMLAGSALGAYGADDSRTGPDITGLHLDQYGADIPDPPASADFQIHGDPRIVPAIGRYVAGPYDVAGGNEGLSFPEAFSSDPYGAILDLCEIEVTLRLTSECQ